MLQFIDKYPDLQETPAQFQERCGQIALACFWRDQQKGEPAALSLDWKALPPPRPHGADETLVEDRPITEIQEVESN
jgi:hypothetical protein